MAKKRRTGLAIGLAAFCIAVLCAAGACNGIAKEEKAVRPVTTTSTATIPTTITPPTTTAPVTTTTESTAITTTEPQITTAATCSATEQGLGETPTPITTEQTTAANTTVPVTTMQMTTKVSAVTTAPAPTEPHNGQTSGDYIYCIGFGWVFNEGGGGYGETNYDMYCNGNKIGYFG